jgi:hypothetical protein
MSQPILEKELHGTITNKRDARNSVSIIWDKILKAPLNLQNCFCGTPLNFGCLISYDHESGEKVPGFENPQWFYVHCLKCGYDTNIHKIGIRPREIEKCCDSLLTCSECTSFRDPKHPWCYEDHAETTRDTKVCHYFQYKE